MKLPSGWEAKRRRRSSALMMASISVLSTKGSEDFKVSAGENFAYIVVVALGSGGSRLQNPYDARHKKR